MVTSSFRLMSQEAFPFLERTSPFSRGSGTRAGKAVELEVAVDAAVEVGTGVEVAKKGAKIRRERASALAAEVTTISLFSRKHAFVDCRGRRVFAPPRVSSVYDECGRCGRAVVMVVAGEPLCDWHVTGRLGGDGLRMARANGRRK